jgi:putative ABC transport system permease protein
MACVVGISLAVASLTAGIEHMFDSGAEARNVITFPANGPGEYGTGISRNIVGTILDGPGIARGADGKLLGSAEVLQWLPPAPGFSQGSLYVRGISPGGAALRPGFSILAGRMFHAGARELVVGAGAEHIFGLKLGSKVILPDGEWPIVGVFGANGGFIEGELLTDSDTLMAAGRMGGYGSVLLALNDPRDFNSLREWIIANPDLRLKVERQAEYLSRTANRYTPFFSTISRVVAFMLSIAGLFATVQVMYALANAQARYFALLRAVGYSNIAVASAVVIEAVFLSLIGAAIGVLCATLVFGGMKSSSGDAVFSLHISSTMIYGALIGATALGITGALLPSIRSARLSISQALRST